MDINNLYPLGKAKDCPVKIEFVSYLKKAAIFNNIQKLKGSNISIANDLTPKQREENKILRKHLYLAKQNESNVCYIKKNKLHVNNLIYAPNELQNFEENEFTYQIKPNSAPETPTIQTLGIREEVKKQGKTLDKCVPNTPTTSASASADNEKREKEIKETTRQAKYNKIKTRSGFISSK